jgi:predicted nucleotidyltransferase
MKRDEVLRILRAHRDELREKFGVKSLALFGSMARDEATHTSDIDLLVEFDRPVSLFDLIGVQLDLQGLLGVPKVDVVMREAIYPAIKDDILSEAIDVGPPEVALQDRAHS